MELKQVILINTSLGMRAGKIIAQALHSETLYMDDIMELYICICLSDEEKRRLSNYREWRDLMKKVVLKCTEPELQLIAKTLDEKDIKYYSVHDAGLTQVESGSLTCVAIEPYEESVVDEITGHLKLL